MHRRQRNYFFKQPVGLVHDYGFVSRAKVRVFLFDRFAVATTPGSGEFLEPLFAKSFTAMGGSYCTGVTDTFLVG